MSASPAHVRTRLPYKKPIHLPEPYSAPEATLMIEIFHPLRKTGKRALLLRLPALDQQAGVWGLDQTTARVACGILADNRWEGFFKTISGEIVHDDAFLTESGYVFCLSGGNGEEEEYAVVRDFESWRYPHHALPAIWQFTIPDGRQDSHSRNRTQYSRIDSEEVCCVTAARQVIQQAHLVPVKHTEWFDVNAMYDYVPTSCADINNGANFLPMRSDIHSLMDDGRFCIVPKKPTPTAPGIPTDSPSVTNTGTPTNAYPAIPCYTMGTNRVHLVAHVLRPDAQNDLVEMYHNVSLQSLQGIQSHYLFAAFAEKIFGLCRYFVNDGVSRQALRVVVGDDNQRTYEVEPVVLLPRSGKAPRMSPPKRKLGVGGQGPDPNVSELELRCPEGLAELEHSVDDVETRAEVAWDDHGKKPTYLALSSLDRRSESYEGDSNVFDSRGRSLKRSRRPRDPRTPSTVTSAGVGTPSASADPDSPPQKRRKGSSGNDDQYSFYVTVLQPTNDEEWENEDIWFERQRRRRES